MKNDDLRDDLAFGLPFFRKHADLKLFATMGFAGVYAIGHDAGSPIKIGWTEKPQEKFKQLQGAHWRKLKVHEMTWTTGRMLAMLLDREARSILDGLKIRGEWFDAKPDVVLSAFQRATDKHKIPTFTHDGMIERFYRAKEQSTKRALQSIGHEG